MEHYEFDNDELLFDEDTMLTTVDNPYNPREDLDKWRMYDHEKGYFTSELIDRLAEFDPTDDDYAYRIKLTEAISLILEDDDEGIYMLAK